MYVKEHWEAYVGTARSRGPVPVESWLVTWNKRRAACLLRAALVDPNPQTVAGFVFHAREALRLKRACARP